MRAFICIDLSEEARKEISRIIERIKEADLIRAKFVEQENLHLTLKFLGEISDKELEMTKKALSSLNFKKFKIKLGMLGVFSPRYIRVLWVDLESAGEIEKLQKEIDKLLGNLFQKEERFSSHATIARVKNINDKYVFLDMIQKEKLEDVEFEVKSVKLKKSELFPEGPKYKDLLEVKLK